MGFRRGPQDIGALALVTGADPGAGAYPELTIPAGETWRVWTLAARLVTGAGGAARRLNVDAIDSAGTGLFNFQAGATQAASLTYDYFVMNMGFNATVVVDNILTIHGAFPIVFPTGTVFTIIPSAFEAVDNFGPLRALVDKL